MTIHLFMGGFFFSIITISCVLPCTPQSRDAVYMQAKFKGKKLKDLQINIKTQGKAFCGRLDES